METPDDTTMRRTAPRRRGYSRQLPMNRFRAFGFWILVLVSAFYAYGALVHVLNIVGLSGFEWSSAPLKWKSLDVIYLLLDVTVCMGLFRGLSISILAFYSAGLSQTVLYTRLRSWIMDVPDAVAITPDQDSYLSVLVIFHVTALLLVSFSLWVKAGLTAGHPLDT
ncbi:MAG: hypothetical protein AAFX65_05325 [Cyanobacteria bacterium J06638_7]